jgi:hypothetical protein
MNADERGLTERKGTEPKAEALSVLRRSRLERRLAGKNARPTAHGAALQELPREGKAGVKRSAGQLTHGKTSHEGGSDPRID